MENAFEITRKAWQKRLTDAAAEFRWASAEHAIEMLRALELAESLIRCAIPDAVTQ